MFETIAITDLKFRLLVVPAAVVFAISMIAGVQLLGSDSGLVVGSIVGLGLALGVAYGILRILP